MQAEHRIVIVGGGAGGLELAARLGRRHGPASIHLVDRQGAHIWKPSLHEVAAGTLDIHREGLSYYLLARDRGFTFHQGEVLSVDRERRELQLAPLTDDAGDAWLPARTLAYDTLVLAVGSRTHFFGTPGAAEHALALDATDEAERFRRRFLRLLSDAAQRKASGGDGGVNVAIVGGGATGVELAAELREACRYLTYYGLSGLDPVADVRITLLEGAPRLLSALPERLSATATRLLEGRDVVVRTSVRVARVEADALYDDQGQRFPADLCVWAAGILAPPWLTTLGLPVNRLNQLEVDLTLATPDPAVLALGDCAATPRGEGEEGTLPARAQVAHQQALYLARQLGGRLRGNDRPWPPFRFHDRGSLVSVGHTRGVGSLMGVLSGRGWFVAGGLARLMYMSLHLMHHLAVLGPLRTASLALGRLLLTRGTPRVKLH